MYKIITGFIIGVMLSVGVTTHAQSNFYPQIVSLLTKLNSLLEQKNEMLEEQVSDMRKQLSLCTSYVNPNKTEAPEATQTKTTKKEKEVECPDNTFKREGVGGQTICVKGDAKTGSSDYIPPAPENWGECPEGEEWYTSINGCRKK